MSRLDADLDRLHRGHLAGDPGATSALLRELERAGRITPFLAPLEALEAWLLESLEEPAPGARWTPPPFAESGLDTLIGLWEEEGLAQAVCYGRGATWWETLDAHPEGHDLKRRVRDLDALARVGESERWHDGLLFELLGRIAVDHLQGRSERAGRTRSRVLDASWRFNDAAVLRGAFADTLRWGFARWRTLQPNGLAMWATEALTRWRALDPHGVFEQTELLAREAPPSVLTALGRAETERLIEEVEREMDAGDPETIARGGLAAALLRLRQEQWQRAETLLMWAGEALADLGLEEASGALWIAAAGFSEPLADALSASGVDAPLGDAIRADAEGELMRGEEAEAIWTHRAELHAMWGAL